MPIEILEDTVVYGAKTKLLELAVETAEIRNLTKLDAKAKINKGFKIFLWLQALDYEFLTKDQRDQILYCLVDLADVNDLPVGPTLGNTGTPSIIVGGTTSVVNNYYQAGTVYQNDNVDIGTETADSFAIGNTHGAVWHYTARSGSNQRSGMIVGTWLSTGASITFAEDSTSDIGSTSPLTLSVDYSGGLIRLRATATTDNWIVEGTRYLIY
jgi:hypothetical protein